MQRLKGSAHLVRWNQARDIGMRVGALQDRDASPIQTPSHSRHDPGHAAHARADDRDFGHRRLGLHLEPEGGQNLGRPVRLPEVDRVLRREFEALFGPTRGEPAAS